MARQMCPPTAVVHSIYRRLCGYLVTVRELYNRLDEYERWEQYLAGVREKYRTLRALKEEMAAAGLLD